MKYFQKNQHYLRILFYCLFLLIIGISAYFFRSATDFFLFKDKKIIAEGDQCIDGTPLNQCSGQGNSGIKGSPYYCITKPSTGLPTLVQNCEPCGCDAGDYCTNSSVNLGAGTPVGHCFSEPFETAYNNNPLFNCRLNGPNLTDNIGIAGADLGITVWHNNQVYYFFGDGGPGNNPYATSNANFCPTLNYFVDSGTNLASSMIDWPIEVGSNVPGGGISLNGKIYVFIMHNDWNGPISEDSYLVKSENNGLTFEKVSGVAWGPDTKFLNIAPVDGQLNGQNVIFFLATGNYGSSAVYLGYTSDIENLNSYRYYIGLDSGNQPSWSINPNDAIAVINTTAGRELSVQWNSYLNKYIAIITSNGLNYASGEHLWGPWEIQPITEINDSLHADWYGFYGGYIVPLMTQNNYLYFVFSSWNPYSSYIVNIDLNNYENISCEGLTSCSSYTNSESMCFSDPCNLGECAWNGSSCADASALVGPGPTNQEGRLVKTDLGSTVYYLSETNHNRYTFPNEDVFYSWFYNFNDVQTISLNELQSYPLVDNITMRPGTHLIKIQADAKVYAVEPGGILRWITSESIFYALGYNFSMVVDVPEIFFQNYVRGENVDETTIHSQGVLIKYPNNSTTYYWDGNNKRAFQNESAFQQNRFYWENVLTIPQTIQYPTGNLITGRENNLILSW